MSDQNKPEEISDAPANTPIWIWGASTIAAAYALMFLIR